MVFFFLFLPYFQDDATQKKKSPYFLSKCFYLHKSACCLPELCVWLSNANITCQLRMQQSCATNKRIHHGKANARGKSARLSRLFLTFPLIFKTLWWIFSRRLHAETSHFSLHFTLQTTGCTLFKLRTYFTSNPSYLSSASSISHLQPMGSAPTRSVI